MKVSRGFPAQRFRPNVWETIQAKAVFMAEYQHSIKCCKHNEAIVNALCAVWQAGRIYQAAAMFADTVTESVAVYDKLMYADGMSIKRNE